MGKHVPEKSASDERKSRIGIFGGTFDPIHIAHLHCADVACEALGLDKVIFVPAFIPSFKQEKDLADFHHRLKMCELAVQVNDKFSVSDIEFARGGVSYTVDTVKEFLEGECAGSQLYFIIGSDAFLTLPKWKQASELVDLVDFIVLMRPGDANDSVEHVASKMGAKAYCIEGGEMDISSSHIRELCRNGEAPKSLLTGSVFEYISRKGLYHV